MDHSVAFARHLARLHWLLLDEPANIEEQKATLRALVTVTGDGPVTLEARRDAVGRDVLHANEQEVSAVFPGVRELCERLRLQGVRRLTAAAPAAPADLLNAARLLASEPDPGVPPDERLRATGATTVHLTPVTLPPDRAAPADEARAATALDGFELVDDSVSELDGPPRPPVTPAPAIEPGRTGSGMFDHFASAATTGRPDALLAALEAAPDDQVFDLLDRLAVAADTAVRGDDARVLAGIVDGVIRRESRAAAAARRTFALAMRRIATPHGLRMIAGLLPRRVLPRELVERVLTRTGEEGAEAVIAQLTEAQTATDRRAYFELLRSLRAAIPALVHMLGDARWYVVRNAIDLLAEMQVPEAEQPIMQLLTHDDERVRASATAALLRLDTPASRAAMVKAVQSEEPATRERAIRALAARSDDRTASTLLRALDREEDAAVQRTIYAALGKVGTGDAVERLVRAAEPASGLFRRKDPELRAAAALALGEAKTDAALEALRRLAHDRERAVRDAAQRALANARRRDEPRVTSSFDSIPE